MLENKFKTKLVKELQSKYPDAMILHLDPNEIQGIPDLIILNGKHWASLEGKKSKDEPFRPNQPHYINKMNNMSFSRVIYPENKEEVLDELQQAFLDN